MAKILVTGALGFIGSNLTQALIRQEHEVIAIDNFDPYYPAFIKKHNLEEIKKVGKFTFIKGDLRDYSFMKKLIQDERIEIIFHESALPGVRKSIENPIETNRTNVDATLNLLSISSQGELELFVNASSSSVYGDPIYLPLDEAHPTNPISPYGVSKLAAEHYASIFFRIYGLPTVSLRYFTVYGPRMRPDLAIFSFTKSLLDNKRPIVYGNGEQTRDFTYVDDIVEANIKTLERKPKGEVINIGSGKRVSINQILQFLIAVTGKNIKPIYKEKVKGDVSHTWADTNKAKNLLGWQPHTDIKTGLKQFVDWYIKNRHFY